MAWQSKPHFDVHPSVVYQLGESLITDTVQALIELVKNSYDADASYVKVTIDTQGVLVVPGSIYEGTGGRIVIEDDGFGMSRDDVESGWLLISSRRKLDVKKSKRTTPGGRTPLGDKGLGRLGVQRLGENLEVFTKSEYEPGYHFGFSWLDFATAPKLQDVNIHFENINFQRQRGTNVVISNLHEIEAWQGADAIKKLEKDLSQMISPYREIRSFVVLVEVDGKILELTEISDKIREIAPIRYTLNFDGKSLVINGRARLDFFRPSKSSDADFFAVTVEADGGRAFLDYLQQQKQAQQIGLSQSKSRQWFVEFALEKSFDDLDKLEPESPVSEQRANPGPFVGEVDSFDLGPAAFRGQNVFDRVKEYREYIKAIGRVQVYRDGFAIRMDTDWLKLGAQWTSASSYYGLKPENTVGYIALTALGNMQLEETTDREGFKDTPYYRNFLALLQEFKSFTSIAHEFFGRSASDFRKKRTEELARVDSRKTLGELAYAIRGGLVDAVRHGTSLETLGARLSVAVSESQALAHDFREAITVSPDLRIRVTDMFVALESLIGDAREVIGQSASYLAELRKLGGIGQVIQDRAENLIQQMDEMYETVALGITAEALSHEIFNVADQLSRRSKNALTSARNKGISDRTILTFIEYVNSGVMALRKQTSFLSPALRFAREQRQDIDLEVFLDELRQFYHDRLYKNSITIEVRSKSGESLRILMNRGKLLQIMDNFVLNSEYWLKEDIARKRVEMGLIVFEINPPFVRIWDTGRGIDPAVELTLFEPFVTGKGRGKGRGLGLFIVKQLLDADGCSVGIVPERNRHRRLYKFQIDFRGAIND